ncbi:MAG: hypothetical protein ACI9QC_000847 [Oceanicoccus sp.]|jgi:hypothetical protein
MIRRPILTIAISSFLISLTLFVSIVTNDNIQANFFGGSVPVAQGFILPATTRVVDTTEGVELAENAIAAKSGDWTYCDYEMPEVPEYQIDMVTSGIDENIQGGDTFYVNYTYINNGNSRIFAADSQCDDAPILNLGTQMSQDRVSLFGDDDHAVSGWINPSRIKMADKYADPGEKFQISFQSIAPEGDNIYREFFQPLIEDYGWIDGIFIEDIVVGNPSEQMHDDIQFVLSTSLDAASLTGLVRNVEINLTEQMMYANFGDIAAWGMPTSSGAWDTPTPTGTFTIFQKQELRVGGAAPHYRMPWWQFFRSDGYGLHGMPYLGGDAEDSAFWVEANDHIGTPVSHGCVRSLTKDAETLYKFTSIGTELNIHY